LAFFVGPLFFVEAKVVYTSKDGRTSKSFPALEWLANLSSHIPNRGEQMMRYSGFGITIAGYSSTGNPHFNSKVKFVDKVYDTVRVIERSSGKRIYSTNHALWHQVKYRFTSPILPRRPRVVYNIH
jgi:hypothetical protein